MSNFMDFDNAKEFARDINGLISTKQNILTAGNGIILDNNIVSLGAFVLLSQTFIYDDTCYGEILLVKRNNRTILQIPLDSSGSVVLYLGSLGTYTYEIDLVPGIPSFSVERTYTTLGTTTPISITITPPVKADMYPFATATDQQLSDMLNSYYGGLYDANDIALLRSTYLPVGAKRTIHLAHMDPDHNCNDSHFGSEGADYDFIIIGFEHDDLAEPIGNKTKALLTLHQERILYKNTTDEECYYTNAPGDQGFPSYNVGGGYMHSTASSNPYAHWESCDRRAWCNDTYKNALPEYIQNLIRTVVKPTVLFIDYSYTLRDVLDDVFYLSEYECWGERRMRSEMEGDVYEYYSIANDPNRERLCKYPHFNSGSEQSPGYKYTSGWWSLRTLSSSNYFAEIFGEGYDSSSVPPSPALPVYTSGYIINCYGIAPAFCI